MIRRRAGGLVSIDYGAIAAERLDEGTGLAPASGVAHALDDLLGEIAALTLNLRHLARSDAISVDARFEAVTRLDDRLRDCIPQLEEAGATFEASKLSVIRRTLACGRDAFGALLDAYQGCIHSYEDQVNDPARRGYLNDCRFALVRAGADRIIWERCCGGPVHGQLWRWLGAAFFHAVSRDGSRMALRFGSPGSAVACVESEYLRAVAAHSAALDVLDPRYIAPIDRLLAFALPMLQFQATPIAGSTYHVDPRSSVAPRRMVRIPDSITGLWFFSPRAALDALQKIAREVQDGNVPAGLALTEPDDTSLNAALAHLLRHWSDTPPVRRHRRHLLGGMLSAVRGIDELKRLFSGQVVMQQAEWSLRDVSRGGLGAYAPTHSDPSVRVGELVGVSPHDGRSWQLAVVRRTWGELGHYPLVGLETLSQNPSLADVDDGRTRACVLLCDPLLRGEAVRIAAPANLLSPGVPLFVTSNGSIQKLKPLESSMTGDGFELRVYQVL
jgi:hypothetical protein